MVVGCDCWSAGIDLYEDRLRAGLFISLHPDVTWPGPWVGAQAQARLGTYNVYMQSDRSEQQVKTV